MLDEESSNYFVLFLFLAIAILLIIAYIHQYTSFDEPIQVIIIDPQELKTGDIVGVGYDNLAGRFTSSFSRSVWSHTGTIWVDPQTNIVYVLEAAIYPDKKYQHAMRIPFDKWYNYNNRFILGLIKYSGPPLNPYTFIKAYSRFENKVNLEGFNISWSRFLSEKSYFKSQTNKTYTCYEITVLLNQDLGIYKKEKLHTSYFPRHIMNGKIPCENGHSYQSVKRFFLTPGTHRLYELERYHSRKNRKN